MTTIIPDCICTRTVTKVSDNNAEVRYYIKDKDGVDYLVNEKTETIALSPAQTEITQINDRITNINDEMTALVAELNARKTLLQAVVTALTT